MAYQDITIDCKDCGNQFVWSASGQEFFAEKGFSKPVRCKNCREAKKQQQGNGR